MPMLLDKHNTILKDVIWNSKVILGILYPLIKCFRPHLLKYFLIILHQFLYIYIYIYIYIYDVLYQHNRPVIALLTHFINLTPKSYKKYSSDNINK